jgi:16S rRNA (uracil1498-N3)-methyltransferase
MGPNNNNVGRQIRDRQMRRFFAGPEQFRSDEVVLSPSETHHLTKVLRLQKGERVEVSDGCGKIFSAEIALLEPAAAHLKIISEVTTSLESTLQITLGLALVRSETFDLLVRQVTEMGIYRLVPFHASRSLIKPGNWKKSRHNRWLRLAQGALKSSQRKNLPEIELPVDFPEVLQGTEDLKILFWEEQREHYARLDSITAPRPPQSVRALIGPEGGFTTSEVSAAQEAGFIVAGLGPRRLRVETAAMAAVAILQYLWGDI